jgi:hypothetical protein
MPENVSGSPESSNKWRYLSKLSLVVILIAMLLAGSLSGLVVQAQSNLGYSNTDASVLNPADPRVEEQIEQAWHPDYLKLATGDPTLLSEHGIYAWPFDLNSIGWSIQSYQDYGGTPYFHHGIDMMKDWGTNVFNRSGGQVINIENYQPGWDLYWEVAILDPDGYIWQYHHIKMETIPQEIWNAWYDYQADPNTGYIEPNTYIGNIIEWPVWSFGKQFNHIHLNILAAGGVYVNGFEFHVPLPDMVGPQIQSVGLLKNGQVYPGNEIEGDYSLYVQARDLILDDVYHLPPYEITFLVDDGPVNTTWRFDTLPGGADDTAYLDDFYVVPPTCGNYDCRNYYIDLGFIPDSQYIFPASGGEHSVLVTVSDYAGNSASQLFTYMVIGPPNHAPLADPQQVTTAEDTATNIVLTGSDQDGDQITFSVITNPNHGTLGGIAPNLVYTPTANYNGTDNFTFITNDGQADSEPAEVSIDITPVNDAPVANPQEVVTRAGVLVAITLSGSDVDGDSLIFSISTPPNHGTLMGEAPNLEYVPTSGYLGEDEFSFIVNDGELDSFPVMVSITVNPDLIYVSIIYR